MSETILTAVQIKVIDEASKALEEIKRKFGGLDDGIKKQQSFLLKHKDAIKAVGVASAAAGAAILGAAGLAVAAAQEQAKANKQLDAVLKSTKGAAGLTAKEIQKMATEMQNVTNYADDVVQGGQNLLLTFTKIGKDVFPQATETMLNMSTALGQDVKSSAIQLSKALNDPIRGVSALQKVGVSFTQGQKDVIESLVKSGKTMEAQKLILNELETEFGGSARALANPMVQLKNAVSDVAEEVGFALLPTLQSITKEIIPVIQRMAEWIKQHPELMKVVLELTIVLAGLLAVVGAIGLALPKVVAGLSALKVLSGITIVFAAISSAMQSVQIAMMYGFIPGMKLLTAQVVASLATMGAALKAFIASNPFLVLTAIVAAAGVAIYAVMKKIQGQWDQTAKSAQENTSRVTEQYDRWVAASKNLTGREAEYAKIRVNLAYFTMQSVLATEKAIAVARADGTAQQVADAQAQVDFNNRKIAELQTTAMDFAKTHKGVADKVVAGYKAMATGAQGSADDTGGALDDTKEKLEEVREKVRDLGKSYDETVVDVNRRLQSLKKENEDAMLSIQENIRDTQDAMDDLATSYGRATRDMDQSDAERVASQIKTLNDLKKKIADEEQNLKEKYINTSSASPRDRARLEELQAELAQEQAAYDAYVKAHPDIAAKGQTLSTQTDFMKDMASSAQKRADEAQDHQTKLTELQTEMEKLEEKATKVQEAYAIERQELLTTKTALQEFGNEYFRILGEINTVTDETAKNLSAQFESIKASLSGIEARTQRKTEQKTGVQAKAANGGIFHQPTVALVGEGRYSEAVVPLPDGRSIPVVMDKPTAGNVTIQIDHVEMASTMDVNTVFEMLARKLQLYQLRSA